MTTLPPALRDGPWRRRVEVALLAARSAGAALIAVRGSTSTAEERGDQLKTSVDRAAEGWVLGFLDAEFPEDTVLAEERHSDQKAEFGPHRAYWTVDALDGTRSFMEGFSGFCVQVAWVEDGVPKVGVIAEPVTSAVYVAAKGDGAYRLHGETWTRLRVTPPSNAPPRFVDSIPPSGVVGRWIARTGGSFLECGSCGLKLARVAEGAADVYAKRFRYRLWDVAPGHVLLEEAGGRLSQWNGNPVDFSGSRVEWDSLLVSASDTLAAAVEALKGA